MNQHLDPATAPNGVLIAIDGQGHDLENPYAQHQDRAWIWIHLSQRSEVARRWILKESGIPPHEARALVAEHTRPRCTQYDNGLLFIGRGVNMDPESTPEDMVSIRAWIDEKRIVSVVLRRLRSAEAVADEFGSESPPSSPQAVLSRLMHHMVDRIGPVVEDLAEKLEDIQEDVIDDNTPTLHASALSPIRLSTIGLYRYLVPMHDAASALVSSPTLANSSDVVTELVATRDRLARLTEELNAIETRAGVTRDEIVSRRAEELNDRVYALTILAGVFLPLSVITGLLGMNVDGIPLSSNPAGFWITTISLVVLLVISLTLLRMKRWI